VRELSICCSMVRDLGVLEVYKGGVPPRVQPEAGPGGGECYVCTRPLRKGV